MKCPYCKVTMIIFRCCYNNYNYITYYYLPIAGLCYLNYILESNQQTTSNSLHTQTNVAKLLTKEMGTGLSRGQTTESCNWSVETLTVLEIDHGNALFDAQEPFLVPAEFVSRLFC